MASSAPPRNPAESVAELMGYQIVKEIGRGGCAIVWEATRDGARYAIKALSGHRFPITEQMRERFRREARVLANISHPNVVRCEAFHEGEDGIDILVMPRATASLSQVLTGSEGPLETDLALLWLTEIATGLGRLHAHGIVHRDVTPKNVLLMDDGTACLADLGAARDIEDVTITRQGEPLGSLVYISPEQRNNPHDATPTSDVFSLGQIAFFLVTGMHPHGATQSTDHYGTTLDRQVAALVDHFRSYRPNQRPHDGNEAARLLRASFDQFRNGSPGGMPRAGTRALDVEILASRQGVAVDSLPIEVRKGVHDVLSIGPFYVESQGASLDLGWLTTQTLERVTRHRTWAEIWLRNTRTGRRILTQGPQALGPCGSPDSSLAKLSALDGTRAFSKAACYAAPSCCIDCGARMRRAGHDAHPGGIKYGYCKVCSPELGRCFPCGREPTIIADADEWGNFGVIACSECGRTEDGAMATGPPEAIGSQGPLKFREIEAVLARGPPVEMYPE